MYRTYLALTGVFILGGCPSAAPSGGAVAPRQLDPPSPAAMALAEHGPVFFATPGVLEVVADEAGTGLHATLCAETAGRGLRGLQLSVPVTFAVAQAPLPTACGCSHEGRYYSPGESYPVACNTCRCAESGQTTCTLLACDVAILTKVLFPLNSSNLDAAGRAVAVTVVDLLRRHATMRVRIRGHASPSETSVDELSAARAATIRDFLVAERVDPARLEVSAVGDAVPLFADATKEQKDPAVRRVSFDVISP